MNDQTNTSCLCPVDWRENGTDARFDFPLQLYPTPVLTGITATCALLFLVGVGGNLLAVLAVLKYKDMRTTTNLYLCSVALSDLLIFLCMPLDLYRVWRYRPWTLGGAACKLFQFVSESCAYSAVLSITALSVERYVAVCFPLRAKVLVTRGRVKALILLLWLVALCSAGPVFALVGVEHENGTDPRETGECKATQRAVQSGLLRVMVWISSMFFFLPVLCLTVLYSLISRTLWRRKTKPVGPGSSRDKNNTQTVKMSAVVVLAFVLCWLPFHVGRFLFSRSSEASSPLMAQIGEYCNLASFVLFYFNAAINPILYNVMSRRYRLVARRLLGGACARERAKSAAANSENCPAWNESSGTM